MEPLRRGVWMEMRGLTPMTSSRDGADGTPPSVGAAPTPGTLAPGAEGVLPSVVCAVCWFCCCGGSAGGKMNWKPIRMVSDKAIARRRLRCSIRRDGLQGGGP